MESAAQAIFEEWSPPLFLTLSMLLVAAVYARGWFLIRKTRRSQFPSWRLCCFLLGIGILWISIASPLDGFADALLSAHMVEHLLLMSFVPPLVLLGQPVVPLLRGLPRSFTRSILGPFIRLRSLRRLTHWLTTPLVAWIAMNLTFLVWHIPAAYDFALGNERVHDFEHLCFLGTAILFWWPLLRPWPWRSAWPSPSRFSRRAKTRPETGRFQIAVRTTLPCHAISRGRPTLTDKSFGIGSSNESSFNLLIGCHQGMTPKA